MKTEYLTSESVRRYKKAYYERNRESILRKKRKKYRDGKDKCCEENTQLISAQDAEIIRNMCDLNMNVSAVAENVYLHRNTVIYHLRKIAEKTGPNPMRFYDLVKLKEMVDNENGKGDAVC